MLRSKTSQNRTWCLAKLLSCLDCSSASHLFFLPVPGTGTAISYLFFYCIAPKIPSYKQKKGRKFTHE